MESAATSSDLLSPEDRALLNSCQPTSGVIRKGGVGKTYSTTTASVMYAEAGLYVWHLEMDSQDTSGLHLGLRDLDRTYDKGDGGVGLAAALTTGAPLPFVSGVRTYANGGRLDVIPTGPALDAALTALSIMGYVQKAPYQGRLAELLVTAIRARQAAGEPIPDVIMVDADPKIREARELVYATVRYFFSTIDADPASWADGIQTICNELPEARKLNPTLVFLGALPYKIPLQTIRADLKAMERQAAGATSRSANHLTSMRTWLTERFVDQAFGVEHQYGLPVVFRSAIRESTLAAARTRGQGMTLLEVRSSRSQLESARESGPSALELVRRQAAGEDVTAELEELRRLTDAIRSLPGAAENILADFRGWFVELLSVIARVETQERAQ